MTAQLHVPVFEPIVETQGQNAGKLTPYGVKNWQTLGSTAVSGITQLTGDGTTPAGGGVEPLTLATVNADVGTFGDSTHVAQVTVNGKGLVTAAANVAIAGGTGASAVPILVASNTTVSSGTGMVIPEQLEIAAGVIFEIEGGARVEITGPIEQTLTYVKTGNQQVISSAVLFSDGELQCPIAANSITVIQGMLVASGATTGDIRVAVNVPSGASGVWGGSSFDNAVTAFGASAGVAPFASTDLTDTGVAGWGTVGASTLTSIFISATVINTQSGNTAGTFAVRWAQRVSDATATTLYKGSWIRATRVR